MIVAAAVLYYAFADEDSGPPPRTSLASLATVLATATTPGAAAITELMSTGRPHGIEQLRVIGNAARARELRRLRLPLLEIMRTNANDSTLVCACSSVLSVCRSRAPLAGHPSVSHGLRITQVLMYRSTAPALSERRDAVAWAPSFSATAAAVMRADDAATGRAWWCALKSLMAYHILAGTALPDKIMHARRGIPARAAYGMRFAAAGGAPVDSCSDSPALHAEHVANMIDTAGALLLIGGPRAHVSGRSWCVVRFF